MFKSRLIPALFGYILLILVPIVLMIIQGLQSLQQKKEDIYHTSRVELKNKDEHLRYTLAREWTNFIDREQSRSAEDYFPVNLPHKNIFWTKQKTPAYQRSPLWGTLAKVDTLKGTQNPSSHLFQTALVGYFEYVPALKKMASPYDPQAYFKDTPEGYSHYKSFLRESVLPQLREQFELRRFKADEPLSLLLRMKTHRTHKSLERRAAFSEILEPEQFADKNLIDVSYYNFQFHTFSWQSDQYLLGVRAILIENQVIRIQGFMIHMFTLLQEIQAYLEPLQPDFGQLVLGFSIKGGKPFFEPFNMLSSTIVIHDDFKAVENFKADQIRFWQVMITLIVILLFSSLALARMIMTESTLNQKKTDFISAVTHELKTPLTSIQMYAEMLLEGWAKGKEQVYYRHINSESKRLTRLISNILNFSRLEKGTFILNKSNIELGEFIADFLVSWETWLEESGLKVIHEPFEETWIHVDPDALRQVFYNLCDNAIKYAGAPDGTRLTIEVKPREDEVTMNIHDNGPGISQKEQTRIFQRFYRIENEATRESTGTGLGLALVKEIILECGGTVSLFTPEKGGFGLSITFPKVDVSD